MAVSSVFKQIGKDLLRAAFPDAYRMAHKYREVLRRPSSSQEIAKDPLVGSVTELNKSVVETNEISANILEAL